MALLVVDIDNFKQFNDTYGHDQGDLILQHVSTILSQAARESDYVCRYGGEEFAIILPNTGEHNATQIAERMCGLISQHETDGKHVTVSIGVSVYDGEDNVDVKKLFKNTDLSLYKAKQGGRNRVVKFSLEMAQSDA